MSRQKLIAIVGGLVAFVLVAFVLLARPGKVDFLPAPTPNAFTLLRDAALFIEGPNPRTVHTNLGAVVEMNRAALAAMRDALKQDAELPEEYYARGQQDRILQTLDQIRALALVAELQGRHAEEQKEWGGAAEAYMDIVRAGQALERGPVVCAMIGIAVQQVGFDGLRRISGHLAGQDRQRIVSQLLAVDGSCISFEEVMQRERHYAKFQPGGMNPFVRLSMRDMFKRAEEKFKRAEEKFNQGRADLKLTRDVLEGKVPAPNAEAPAK